MKQTTRVLLVEDYAPIREFLADAIHRIPNLQVAACASDGFEAVQKAEAIHPELILLDISLPTLNGIATARLIRNVSPESKILIVSAHRCRDFVREAFRSGAIGYLAKVDVPSELPLAVESVLLGRRFLSLSVDDSE
jgi:two-component system, NarL family, response regulator NreC